MSRRPGRRGRRRRTGLLLTALLGVLFAALIVVFAVRSANQPGGRLQGAFGGGPYDMGRAGVLARAVARDGPILLPDPLRHNRDLYVQHLGGDATKGWLAFEAHSPGASRRCLLRWEPAARHFRDPCDGRAYPADGPGLTSFPATVDGRGHVVIDLGGGQR